MLFTSIFVTRKAIILGAAGRDFHNFNVYFKNNRQLKVVAFTATQIPYISDRNYPANMAGRGYPRGIPIFDEKQLPELIGKHNVDDVYFSYSDVSHEYVMHLASRALASGASFHLLGQKDTMLKSRKPVISIVATRTGAGKSTIARYISSIIKSLGMKPVAVRHPMPYGDLSIPIQRFEKYEDLEKYHVTIEEREEYEQHIETGTVTYAGVDYKRILRVAEKAGDVILWDGGNNDMPFYYPDLNICVTDPLRLNDVLGSYPGEVNFLAADIIVINKVNISSKEQVDELVRLAKKENPKALVVKTNSEGTLDNPKLVEGKKVLVVEDGPTVTHGGLPDAAGAYVSRKNNAELVDPRSFAVGTIADIYREYPHIGAVLPALGYNCKQLKDLEKTIARVKCDTVVLGTPSDISRIIKIEKPIVRVWFEAKEVDGNRLKEKLISILTKLRDHGKNPFGKETNN